MALFWTERRHSDWPWLTRDAVRIIDSLLRPDDIGIEFGSGRSTIWLAGRCGQLTSVESHREWFTRVSAMLQSQRVTNVRLLHREEPDYARVAADAADRSIDFALVDGIARDQCTRTVAPKIKPGGFLIIDNVNWYVPSKSRSPTSRRTGYETPVWEEAFERDLAGWRCIWTSNGVTDTVILFRP